jgi:hypothetical protein
MMLNIGRSLLDEDGVWMPLMMMIAARTGHDEVQVLLGAGASVGVSLPDHPARKGDGVAFVRRPRGAEAADGEFVVLLPARSAGRCGILEPL